MGAHYLHRLFAPESVAVVGATTREDAVGHIIFDNMIKAGFKGELYGINPKYDELMGKPCFPSIEAIGRPVDVVVIVTPSKSVPGLIRECGENGIPGAVVISAGFREVGAPGIRLEEEMMDAARRYGIRIIGPNCLGTMRPSVGLNATFSQNAALPGNLALIAQSGALCTSVLDWALSEKVGFSSMVSMGGSADVDFGEVLDYLAVDPETKSILLYIEGIRNARRFMSGLRVAARMKPVIVVKAGRYAEGSRAAVSHTGSLVGSDDVFDAALKRAGVVRVLTIGELFEAAHILSAESGVKGNRLAVVTNAGGPGVMAADAAVEAGVNIPDLDDKTMKKLDKVLPAAWSHGNPVDILGDAPPERYRDAVLAIQKSDEIDAVLTMLTPQAMTRPTEAAKQVVDAAKKANKPTITCWMGEGQVHEARQIFSDNRVPYFSTPEASVRAFSYLANYHRNQKLLMQAPRPLSKWSKADVDGARLVIEGALADGRRILSTAESKALLAAFHIPTMPSIEVGSANEALVAAQSLGFPVAMKINSPDITHKSDVGGVKLSINNGRAVRTMFNEMVGSVQESHPDANIKGVTIEKMLRKPNGRELMVGVLRDEVFGPTISFGAGGTAVEILKDRAVGLPPLNEFIARNMIKRTKVAKLLETFRNMPAVDVASIENILLRVSAMVCELPHIQELDINPLIADETGAVAVDARVVVEHYVPTSNRYDHMAIHPYPSHLVSEFQLSDGRNIVIRPIRPEDAELVIEFDKTLSPQTKYFRFMQATHELTPELLTRFTQIDYFREMAFIATTELNGNEAEIAVGRYVTNPDGKSCEFALVVGDEWRRLGIGSRIMMALMEVAKSRGLQVMEGEILSENKQMISLARKLGFIVRPQDDDASCQLAARIL
ncbi:MAG: bifunctional acetate--CoA ligase family protein/GNAT family N-acetyltransferase [Candidatus Latescibacterota bacterium]|nr:MAG: bifunctional acetate--CoA ligase family protein/GNAT family N-acetyltransferase [Candidatus Latescibacterota bacterium]